MDHRFFSTTNPFMFFLLMLSGIFFLIVSFVALIGLAFLLITVFVNGEGFHPVYLAISIGLVVIGLWNMIDAGRLIGNVQPRILVLILIRSFIALLPVAFVILFLDR